MHRGVRAVDRNTQSLDFAYACGFGYEVRWTFGDGLYEF